MWSYLWSPLPSLSIGIIPGNLLSLWFLHRRCCLGSTLWIRVIGTHWCCFPPQSHILFSFHFRCNSRGMIGRCFWRVRFLLDVLQGLRLIMVFCRSCWCQNCQNGKLSTQTWKEDGKYKFHFFICILHILYIIVNCVNVCSCASRNWRRHCRHVLLGIFLSYPEWTLHGLKHRPGSIISPNHMMSLDKPVQYRNHVKTFCHFRFNHISDSRSTVLW